jgi:hypothetical protein
MIDENNVARVKKAITTSLVRDKKAIKQAWIDYGEMLLKCPYRQCRQVGEWVRANGLDFVESPVTRSQAKQLARVSTSEPMRLKVIVMCPYSTPGAILNWLSIGICKKKGKPRGPKKGAKQKEKVTKKIPAETIEAAFMAGFTVGMCLGGSAIGA